MCKQNNVNEKAINNLEQGLYEDLANALPSGIYRLRVFHEVSLIEENWSNSKKTPYVIEFVNDRFLEILGLDSLTLQNNSGIISDLIFEDDKADFARKNVEANLRKTTFEWEGRLLINNQKTWIHFKSIPRILENNDVIWTGTLNDISLRKKTEEDIKLKNKELQLLNEDKDIIMSILAHDLRSPFNAILGYLSILTNNLSKLELVKIEQYINIVNNSAISAFHLLDDILLWSRSQSGAIPFNPEEFNLKVIIHKIIDLLKPNADNKNITINIDKTEIINVYADIDLVNTILRNLISNAIKFTNKFGKIVISTENMDNEIIISISDNGIGMSSETISKLFVSTELFSTPGTDNEKGTGFGMLICKKFIEKHGGKIWIESQLGIGSHVKFSLPLNK